MDKIEKFIREHKQRINSKADLKRLIELVENEQIKNADNGMIPGYINNHSDLTDQLSKLRRVSERIDWEEL